MILADKIINERKKNGWSQEELAEKLSVSRQSISKWEGAQSIPDIQKIIKMADIFGVSTDYLLKDELEAKEAAAAPTADDEYENVTKVSMEEANAFIKLNEQIAPRRANMVSLCIFAPIVLLLLIGISQLDGCPFSEELMVGIGVVSLLILIAVAVVFFIIDAAKYKPYEYLEKAPIETMYGVSGMVKERKAAFEQTRIAFIAIGVALCILSPVPLLIASFASASARASNSFVVFMVCVLLLLVGCGVNLLVRAGTISDTFNILLQEEDYTPGAKKKSPLIERVSSIYWACVTAGFLGWSFITNDWGRTWIIWPVAGVMFAVVITIVKSIVNTDER